MEHAYEDGRARVLIRLATLEDAGAIALVESVTWEQGYGSLLPPRLARRPLAATQARWMRALSMPAAGRRVLVACSDQDTIVGFASSSARAGASVARLDMVYVLPEAQRAGVGRALVHAFALDASAQGVTAFWVEVLARNVGARRFYRRLGGVELDRTWTFWGTTPLVLVSTAWTLPAALERIAPVASGA